MQNDVTDATATAFPRNAISSAAFAVGSRGRTRRYSTPCRSWCCAGSKTSRSSGPPSGSSPSSLRPRGGFRNSLCEGHVGRLEESLGLGVTFQKFRKIPASFAFWRFEFVEIFFLFSVWNSLGRHFTHWSTNSSFVFHKQKTFFKDGSVHTKKG